MAEAQKRGVVVEMNLFCPFYDDVALGRQPDERPRTTSTASATCPRDEVYTLKHADLLAVQEAVTRKIVTELNEFDNLYYEVCNEPYFGGVTLRVAAPHRGADRRDRGEAARTGTSIVA